MMPENQQSPKIGKRIDFILLFDVKDGNPNGDPDMANSPRFDPETFQGLVSDVALKRKIRDWVFAKAGESGTLKPGYDVFVLQGHSLEERQKMSYTNLKLSMEETPEADEATDDEVDEVDDEVESKKDLKKAAATSKAPIKKLKANIADARAWMCGNFFDVRAFGAVMSTKKFNCGQVRGPVQITFARSFDRILSTEHGITRVAYTTQEKADSLTSSTEMANKHTVAYGLYQAHGFINPNLDTGFTEADQEMLFQAIFNMWDLDRSAARGLMACRGLYAFEHESKLGNFPAHKLFERITVKKKDGVEAPRTFTDYTVTINEKDLPNGVKLRRIFE
jgi:CRISPR-associated protein Csd2